LAIGRGSRHLAIWEKVLHGQWRELANTDSAEKGSRATPTGTRDVAWCPNICRNQHDIIATCGVGATLWRFDMRDDSQGGSIYQLRAIKELVPPDSDVGPVLRCSWNLVGMMLAVSPENGEVMIWKPGNEQNWNLEYVGSS